MLPVHSRDRGTGCWTERMHAMCGGKVRVRGWDGDLHLMRGGDVLPGWLVHQHGMPCGSILQRAGCYRMPELPFRVICKRFRGHRVHFLQQRDVLPIGLNGEHGVHDGERVRDAGLAGRLRQQLLLSCRDHRLRAVRDRERVPYALHSNTVRSHVLLPAGVDCPDAVRRRVGVRHALVAGGLRGRVRMPCRVHGADRVQPGRVLSGGGVRVDPMRGGPVL